MAESPFKKIPSESLRFLKDLAGECCCKCCIEIKKTRADEVDKPFSLLAFPSDILYDIMKKCDNQSLKSLRLATRSTCAIASKILFREFKIGLSFTKDTPKPLRLIRPRNKVSGQIRAHKGPIIVRRFTGLGKFDNMTFLFENVRELCVERFRTGYISESDAFLEQPSRIPQIWVRDYQSEYKEIKRISAWSVETFRLFLTAFKKLMVFRWDIDYRAVYDLLTVPHKSLDTLQLALNLNSVTSLVTDLYFFKLWAPVETLQQTSLALHTLELQTYEGIDFRDDMVPRHLSNLHTLTVEIMEPPQVTFRERPEYDIDVDLILHGTPIGDKKETELMIRESLPLSNTIWDSLLRHSVPLRHLTVGSQSESLLKFLISCDHSLEKIDISIQEYLCRGRGFRFHPTKRQCLAEHYSVKRFMDGFWGNAIPNHKSTLKYLSIRGPREHYTEETVWKRAHYANVLDRLDLCTFTLAARDALQTCQALEYLQIGAKEVSKVKDAVKWALSFVSLRNFTYVMGGYAFPNDRAEDWPFDTHYGLENVSGTVRKALLDIRWDKDIPDARWKEVKIELVPPAHSSWWPERDFTESRGGCWRYMDDAVVGAEERERMRLMESISSSEYETDYEKKE
ncbi:hypothetical protein TWF694_008056 [Orbilia ellipsospora]|uniref:F-box domain-containing protein n=1 Tax=Orbilia ellipsospora TaxID=2528407 RepID=A0AAV9XLL9_9PEZI